LIADGGGSLAKPLNRPGALPIYGSVIGAMSGVSGPSGIPHSASSLEPYLAPYGSLAVNESQIGGAFRQECGPKVTITGKNAKHDLRLPTP
jgi:hypothetical protein